MTLGTLAALKQRITVRRSMTGMTSDETASYIGHYLKLVGRSDPSPVRKGERSRVVELVFGELVLPLPAADAFAFA
jgi:hypothetical protein